MQDHWCVRGTEEPALGEQDPGLSRQGTGGGVNSGCLVGEMEMSSLGMLEECTGFPAHGQD